MPYSETVQIRGHLLDTGVLSRCVDDVRSLGGDYVIERFDVGKDHEDESYARIRVQTEDESLLASILMRLNAHGVNLTDPGETVLREVTADGVFPADFYSTTNLDTQVRLDGRWVDVSGPEMDCGLLVTGEPGAQQVRTVPVSDVVVGDQIVCGASGVRVVAPVPEFSEDGEIFEFMNSEVSSEKPQALLVRQIAEEMRAVKAAGKKVLWVGGPAVVHTGAAPAMVALVEAGFVDILFGGNAIATHDIESSIYGTSLGVDLSKGRGVEHGHEHHIRAINQIRGCGSIAAAVEQGVLTSGVMHALVVGGKQFVLVGSVRDDGPLPDVHTDVIVGQRKMRGALDGVGFAIMVATMLHSVATGNLLPASIPLVCVDINPATVTKLADRGSSQARGVVTDIGLFLEQLAGELNPGWRARLES
ncbi:TIGR00300 family protein [Angustibacter sp. McL0619]|uniref:ornithine cyclodeaminase n=1 Tax=Angustibacter sp. McL0619 TaxID=3415676 RepID=UPI003CF86C79